MPNLLLLSHLAANSDDETVLRAMSACVFILAGEIGEAGFGATTLQGRLALFTHPEFLVAAGLPPGREAVEATARQAAEYARAVGLAGFVLNPGTHQRLLGEDAVARLHAPLRAPAPPVVPTLAPPAKEVSPILAEAVRAAAANSAVEAAWIAAEDVVATRPHPDPAFEAGLLARDVRVRSYAAEPAWAPTFEREATGRTRVRFRPLSQALGPALAADLQAEARRNGLAELWAFEAQTEGQEATLAFAYAPHPNERFAAGFEVLHARHALGAEAALFDARSFGDALARIGTRLR